MIHLELQEPTFKHVLLPNNLTSSGVEQQVLTTLITVFHYICKIQRYRQLMIIKHNLRKVVNSIYVIVRSIHTK